MPELAKWNWYFGKSRLCRTRLGVYLNGGTQGPRFIIHELSALAEKTPVVARYTEVHRVGPTTEPFSKSSFPIPGNNGWKICIPSMAQNIPQQPVRLITHYHNQSTIIYIYLIYTYIYINIQYFYIFFMLKTESYLWWLYPPCFTINQTSVV